MKKLTTMQDALAFQLQGLMYAQTRINRELSQFSGHVSSPALAQGMAHYSQSAGNKISKLERVFNYLMVKTVSGQNQTIHDLLAEAGHVLEKKPADHLRDILMIGAMQCINAYKTAVYRGAYMFAAEREVDIAVDLIQQMLEWELKSCRVLASLAIEEFNKVQQSLKTQLCWEH